MNTIGTVTCGIKALEGVLNNLVAAINRRTVDTGAGLTKHESDGGILISLASAKDAGNADSPTTQGTGGGGTGAWEVTPDGEKATWQKVVVLDANCNPLEQWLWGGSPGGNPANSTQSAQVPQSGRVTGGTP
jgi:hypothetical protein